MLRRGRAGVVLASALSLAGCAELLGVEDWRDDAGASSSGSGAGAGSGASATTGGSGGFAGGAAGGTAGAGGDCAAPCGETCCPVGTTCSLGSCTCLAGIRARDSVGCALTSLGSAQCWGDNAHGQTGVGSPAALTPMPVTIQLADVVSLALGHTHACALTAAEEIWCWGEYSSAQLGYAPPMPSDATKPTQPVPGLMHPRGVAVGNNSSCALLEDGQVVCWGANTFGQLGASPRTTKQSASPIVVPGIAGATQITFGFSHVCALLKTGSVSCWGANGYGQLGNSAAGLCNMERTTPCSYQPQAVAEVHDVAEVVAQSNHTCARTKTGEVWCWGSNAVGEGGDISDKVACPETPQPNCRGPTQVAVGAVAVSIALGTNQSCALLEDGSSRCWGLNEKTLFGTPGMFGVPEATGFPPAVEMALGDWHMCVRTPDDELLCAGGNELNQFGNGTMVPSETPVATAIMCP